MISGLYESATAMAIEDVRHDVIANNIANAATPGFKKETTSLHPFDEIMSSATRKIGESDSLYQSPISSQGMESHIDFEQGPMKQTGNELDVAINGDGFFAIQTPDGIRYTRAGNFSLNPNGQLVMTGNPEHQVLGTGNAPITITNNEGEIFIDRGGNIVAGGDLVGKLQVSDFEMPYRLRKIGKNLFMPEEEDSATDAVAGSYAIERKALEMSNVNIIEEMVAMIINQRNFELGQRMIMAQDQTIQKAISDVGRV